MNAGDDELSSGLNGRLRPRKLGATSNQIKAVQKSDAKLLNDKSRIYLTSSTTPPNKPNDLPDKSEFTPALNFLCSYCDKKFVSKQTLSKHTRRMHLSIFKQDFLIGCLFCNHTEQDPNNIFRHMVDSHPNQYFACLDCYTRFSSTSELAEHKLNVCEKQKPYRSKLRQKSSNTKKSSKQLNINCKNEFRSKEYSNEPDYNGIVISCELKPSQVHDAADIEDNITTNVILPPNKNIANNTLLEKNAVIVLDDIQWNKRLPPNFTFHNTDADQILSRLGVIHRTPRSGETNRRDWFKSIEESSPKFEKCFDTSFYSKVASNVQENLAKFLDGSFNFNPDPDNIIKTRKAKNSVVINTVEGFPILLNCAQYSRNMFDGYLPRAITPKHKCKWDSLETDKNSMNSEQFKRDSHTNNCIISLVSNLDIWTQLCMRRKFEEKFCHSPIEKKLEKQNLIDKELKEILESRELPATSSEIVKYANKPTIGGSTLEFSALLGLTPSIPQCPIQPAILSGEWVRPRCYVCCACGAETRDARAFTSHMSSQHPNAQVQHYEIVGELLLNADIVKHLYVPPSQPANRTRPLRGFRECTKCKEPASLEDFHQHMLDCAGDTPTVRRKCRYRPFGVRRRRPRLPDNTIRKKIRKDIRNRQRQKSYMDSRGRPRIKSEVGDAETIRKMLADLPAKRHRVMVNPTNSMLRPRRKFDLQRNKLLMKRRPSDDSKNHKICSKDASNMRNIGESSKKKIPTKENMENKPLRSKMKPITRKPVGQNEAFKRPAVFKKAKRSVKKTTQDEEESEPTESSNNDPPDGLTPNDTPQKIDVNGGPYNMRERSGGNEGKHSGGSSSNPQNGGGSDPGGGENNPNEGNNPNGERPNNNNGRPNGGRENDDRNIAPNTPLKHSIERLTANSETHDKSVQFHHLFLIQQECNNVTEHSDTGQRELFENEAIVTKLDKPPLHYQKRALDPHILQKNKSNKPRKGLNDCIAMLKNKLTDPPSRNMISQVSVQCGDDEPIEHFPPKTVIESGINMTPAQIFYRPILPQNSMLTSQSNIQNVAAYPYSMAQTTKAPPRAEKPKGKQKRYFDGSLPKQKQDAYITKRKSTCLKSVARAQIEMQHKLMRLSPQIEIIPQPSLNAYNVDLTNICSRVPYENIEPNLVINQQILNDASHKRRESLDMKTQLEVTQPKAAVILPKTQVKWSKRQSTDLNPSESTVKNTKNSQSNKQTKAKSPEILSRKPAKDMILSNNSQLISIESYSGTDFNEMSSRIPLAHRSITVDSVMLAPLDLSGKHESTDRSEKRVQDGIYYSTSSYDPGGTLDLSNKRSTYAIATKEHSITDVVDLSVKTMGQHISEHTSINVYDNSLDLNSVTDLSQSGRITDYLPTDLTMKTNGIDSCQEVLLNDNSYEVQDLTGCKLATIAGNSTTYLDINHIDKDKPTDLSGKNISEFSQTSTHSKAIEAHLKETELIVNDLPADLSAIKRKEKQKNITTVIEASVSENTESTQERNIKKSSFSINADKPPEKVLKLNLINNTTTDVRITNLSESIDNGYHSPKALASNFEVCVTSECVQSSPSIDNYSNMTDQQKHDTSILNAPSIKTSSFTCTPKSQNATPNYIMRVIPIHTLHNHIQTNPSSESTKPVYAIANACISMTKIETSSTAILTNTLLSVPGTTIANTTSIYTLAGTSVRPINYGIIPQTVTKMNHIISENIVPRSDISLINEAKRVGNQYNLKAYQNIPDEIEKDSQNSYCAVSAELDPETVSKIAKLPKEIVEILGTMPIDQCKQLLNILPQYVTNNAHDTNLCSDKNYNVSTDQDALFYDETLSEVVPSKKALYLKVQTADSTPGFKHNNNLKLKDESYNNSLHKSQTRENIDVKQIPLPPSPSPHSKFQMVHIDTTEFVQSELDDDDDTKTECYDIKIIDLTQDDFIDGELMKRNNDVDRPTSDLRNNIDTNGNKHKINDQTASLRAVRIKTASERLKVINNENISFCKRPSELQHEDTSGNKDSYKPVSIKKAGVNIKMTEENQSTPSSEVDSKSNNKILKHESSKKTSECITIEIDVNENSEGDNIIVNSDLYADTTENYSNCSRLNKTPIAFDSVNSTKDLPGIIDMNASNDILVCDQKKICDDLIESNSENIEEQVMVLMPTDKQTIINEHEQNQNLNIVVENEKNVPYDDDDSEDDILLAVIVKQKHEKQIINNSDIITSDVVVNDEKQEIKETITDVIRYNELEENISQKTDTTEKHVCNVTSKNKSYTINVKETDLLENKQTFNQNADSLHRDIIDIEQNCLRKKTGLLNEKKNNVELTIYTVEKVDMGVQYEFINKENKEYETTSDVNNHSKICNIKSTLGEQNVKRNMNDCDSKLIHTTETNTNEFRHYNEDIKTFEEKITSIQLPTKDKKYIGEQKTGITLNIENDEQKLNMSCEKTNLHSEKVMKDIVSLDDTLPCSEDITSSNIRLSTSTNKKETELVKEISLCSNIEQNNQIPLRRSRRGKSMFVDRSVSSLYNDSNAINLDTLFEQRAPLTKKQLIFSKLLLDGEKNTNTSEHAALENAVNIKKNNKEGYQNHDIKEIVQNLSGVESTSDVDCTKSKKRSKTQINRKIKKKKIEEDSDMSDKNDYTKAAEVLGSESHPVVKEISITGNKNHSKDFQKNSKCDDIIENASLACNPPSGSDCNISCEKKLISKEKRKIILPTTSKDLALDAKPKKIGSKSVNEASTSGTYQRIDNPENEVVFKQKYETFTKNKPRITCYNRPVAVKRTCSTSSATKSTKNELTYDPYDIDLDDVLGTGEPLERKRFKTDKETSNNREHKPTSFQDIPTTSGINDSELIRRKVKKSMKQRDQLRVHKHIKDNTSDSDDSSKSDVPLTKYFRQKIRRNKISVDDLFERDFYDLALSDDLLSDKNSDTVCLNRRRTLSSCNNVDSSSSHDEEVERLKSEQFLESFGFFSERKPRKSNLLAAKKISETFQIIANESDDAQVGSSERAVKKGMQNEKRSKEGECSKTQVVPKSRKSSRCTRKNKTLAQLLRCFCKLCKREFRRPDNYLRHQLNLFHITRISEELKIKIEPLLEEPNYLIVYKQHIERLKIITDKLAKKKKAEKLVAKLNLPTLTEILVEVNRVVREQLLSKRVLSRDEELFLDCCELLKESPISDTDPRRFSSYRCPQATMTGLALIEKQIDEDQSEDDVDSITAKNILESEEVRNLEKDLISGFQEAANANAQNNNCINQQNTKSNIKLNTNSKSSKTVSHSNTLNEPENVEAPNEPSTSKLKKPEVKRMMYPDIIEDIDMYEDKFDKIKRKSRSQAAAAKQIQNVTESNTRQKIRKKSEKKKVKKNSKKNHQSTQVPTKGALKGFDGEKVSIPQAESSKCPSAHHRSKKKRKKNGSKRKKNKISSESSNKLETDHRDKDTAAGHANVDVYEFMDNEDAELFEFRPSTLMERFKSINNRTVPSTSKMNAITDEAGNTSSSASDGDDFVYMSDDYVGSDNETETSLTCEPGNIKVANDSIKKPLSPLKRKDVLEKNAVMGKIFKHNAVRTEKTSVKYKEDSKEKANMDQLFDSLLEDELCSSTNNSKSKLTDHCSRYVYPSTNAFEDTSTTSPNYVSTPAKSPYHNNIKSTKHYDSTINKYNSYVDYPSTSKRFDEFVNLDYDIKTKKHKNEYKGHEVATQKEFHNILHSKKRDSVASNSSLSECSPNIDDLPKKLNDSTENIKTHSPSNKPDEGIGTSYDYSAELFDVSHDDTGVARQRARRKCTVGKQKVLAETWSSESEPDGTPQRPTSAQSEKSDTGNRTGPKKRGRKRDGYQSSGRRGTNRSSTYKKHDESRLSDNHRNNLDCDNKVNRENESRSGTNWTNNYLGHDIPSCSSAATHKSSTPAKQTPPTSSTSRPILGRPRPSSYNWSSDNDDEQEHLQQHGWIVGDSHKKLVTMLAHAKGRKHNDDKRDFVE